jgi:hypothetical protein
VIEEGKYLLCVLVTRCTRCLSGTTLIRYAQCGKIESPMIKKNLGVVKPNGLDRVTYCMRERSFSFDNNNNDNIYNEYIIFKNCKFMSIPDIGYSRNVSCVLTYVSTFYYYNWSKTLLG